ncbi:MAG TPA: PEP-CTERM sorting domain-containing protein [Fimbriimonadaceae bacterium]|nr:PEP-CTERM sorting domain-containing protein [Fimbriimonadaceae bacterium]
MNHYRSNLALLTTLLMSRVSHSFMIDAFGTPDPANNVTFGNTAYMNRSYVHSYTAPVLGGERDIELQQIERSFVQPPQFFARWEAHPEMNNEVFFRVGATGPGQANGSATGRVFLQYDGLGDELGNLGLDRHLNNVGSGQFALPALGGIRILTSGLYVSASAMVAAAVLRDNGVEIGRVERQLAYQNRRFVETLFPFTNDQMLLADSLTMEFKTETAGDGVRSVYIKQIETIVPEPSSVIGLFGGGGLWLFCRRRTKRVRQ